LADAARAVSPQAAAKSIFVTPDGSRQSMDTIMSTYGAPAAARGTAEHVPNSGLTATLKRWRAAYVAWRSRQAAMVALCAMSDLELRDMGLRRCDIPRGVRGEVTHDPTCIPRA
jgi:uncharacterized protein YjiS (DUF1127 family)